MIKILSALVSITLSLIAILHFLWALRIWIPVNDELQLARTVAGFARIEKMPSSLACFLVAIYVAGAALFVLIVGDLVKQQFVGKLLIEIAAACFAFVLLARGAFAYTDTWSRMTPEEPFRTLDALYYSPLCLILGFSITAILILKH